MNILIVNAFGNSTNGKARFLSFSQIIQRTFTSISKGSGIENFNYIYRTPSNLDDYIYDFEFNTNEGDIKKKNFENIDIVFIDGTEIFLPWNDKGLKLCSFIRQCKVTDKILYAGGVGMLSLVYYLATGSHSDYNFINSEGEIEVIEDLNKLSQTFLKEMKKNDNFLDFVTGDVMQYNHIDNNWTSVMNIGLHKQISAEKYFERGKFVLLDNFMGKDFIKNKNAISSNFKELKFQVTKHFISHYLIKNLPPEFTVYSTLTWFPHNFNVSYKKYQFKVIGMCFKGPILIEHENSVGAAFHSKSSYKESIIILQNFIKRKFSKIQSKLFNYVNNNDEKIEEEIPSMFRAYKVNDEQKRRKIEEINENGIRSSSNEGIVSSSIAFNRMKKVHNNANNVGLSYNNRDMVFVENNSINQRAISCKKNINIRRESKSENQFQTQSLIKRNENTRISEIFKLNETKTNDINLKNQDVIKKIIEKAKKEIDKNEHNNENYMQFVQKAKLPEEQMIHYYKKMRKDITDKLEEIQIASDFRQKKIKINDDTKKKIKKLNLKASNFMRKKKNSNEIIKNIKSYTSRNKNNNDKLNLIFLNEDKKHYGTYRDISPQFRPETTFPEITSENVNKSNKTINKKLLMKKINNSPIKQEYKYITLEEFQRKEFLESKKKWICDEDFHRVFGIHSSSIKPITNVIDAGQPISKHKYRDVHPDKWLTSNGFII